MQHSVLTDYSSMLQNKELASSYEANLSSIQTESIPTVDAKAPGSTDMGNVSHVVPSIHPMFYIGGKGCNHTREFTEDAGMIDILILQTKLCVFIAIPVCCVFEKLSKAKIYHDQHDTIILKSKHLAFPLLL